MNEPCTLTQVFDFVSFESFPMMLTCDLGNGLAEVSKEIGGKIVPVLLTQEGNS